MPRRCRLQDICNAERFDIKAGPFVGSIMETILRMQNGKQDSMPTKMDRNQWTDVWEHRQVNSWCCDSEVEVRKQNCQGQMVFAILEQSWSLLAGT